MNLGRDQQNRQTVVRKFVYLSFLVAGNALELWDVDKVTAPPRVVAQVHGLDVVGTELIDGLVAGVRRVDPAVTERHLVLEDVQVEALAAHLLVR